MFWQLKNILARYVVPALCSGYFATAISTAKADDFIISSSSTDENGGYTIDGSDTLTITSDGSIIRPRVCPTCGGTRAVDVTGDDNIVTVNGLLETVGADRANTLVVTGDNNLLTINGLLSPRGFQSRGIEIDGNGNTANISTTGRIVTYGNGLQYAINITGNDNAVNVSGLVHSTRTNSSSPSHAIRVGTAVNTQINISGTVRADADGVAAVRLNSGASSTTVTLQNDARIIGEFQDVGSNNTLRFNVGSAQSFVFATSGNWTLQDLDGRAVVEGSAMAAGIGNVETADELMLDRAFSLDGSLTHLERQATTGERQALFDAYGFSQSRDENGTTAAYELDSRGMTIGLPLELLGNQAIAFVNYHDSEIDIASGTHDIDAQSARFGLSVPKMWSGENYDVGLYAVAGRNSYDGTRDVLVNQNTTTGITTVDASWDSTELEIGADVTSNMALTSKLTLDSSLGLAAQVERVGSYSEQNYFAWDSRTIVQAHAKAEVTLGYQATDATRIYGTAGAWRRDVQSGETAHYTINNTAVSYNGGVYDDTITSLRLGVGHSLSNGAVLSAEAMAMDSSNADSSWGASIGIAARF